MFAGTTTAVAKPKVVARRKLAPGVKYVKMVDASEPVTLYVLRFRPGTKATLDDVLAAKQISAPALTSTMAKRAHALAAVNGDLNDWPGQPTHQYVSNGMVMKTGTPPGISFAFRRDEKGATVGRHPLRISVTDRTTGTAMKVRKWNDGAPRWDQIVAYSWYGGGHDHPAPDQCTVRLIAPSKIRWNAKHSGTGRTYTVGARRCDGSGALAVDRVRNVVLSSRLIGAGSNFLKSLTIGSKVRLGWTNDSPGAVDIVSGSALILSHGQVQYSPGCTADLCLRNPRTAIGVTARGRVIILAVDGRSSVSIGYTLAELGTRMKALGAVDAVNLDGGGSTTMWVRGLGVVNHPTDPTGERPVSNAVVILPGPDRLERVPLKPLPAI